MKIIKLLTEYQENPIGLDEPAPAFSWQLASSRQNVMQQAYHLRVQHGQAVVWDTGRVTSSCAANIVYAGEPLEACQRYADSSLFPNLPVADGCFVLQDQQITADPSSTSIPMLWRLWQVGQGLTRARLYITARGIYKAQVNSQTITNSLLTPA